MIRRQMNNLVMAVVERDLAVALIRREQVVLEVILRELVVVMEAVAVEHHRQARPVEVVVEAVVLQEEEVVVETMVLQQEEVVVEAMVLQEEVVVEAIVLQQEEVLVEAMVLQEKEVVVEAMVLQEEEVVVEAMVLQQEEVLVEAMVLQEEEVVVEAMVLQEEEVVAAEAVDLGEPMKTDLYGAILHLLAWPILTSIIIIDENPRFNKKNLVSPNKRSWKVVNLFRD